MAPRPTWKGHLKVSLVNIPIRVFPATDAAATISFNQLHAECQTRVQQKRWCPTCEEELARTDIVKGYEFEKGRYVVVSEDDLAKVRPESTRVINLIRFADADTVDPTYLDRPYFLAPDGKVASEAYAVMREAMAGRVGIGKLALHGREYLVAVQPHDRGLMMHTLRHARELRQMDALDELQDLPDANPAEVTMAQQVISSFVGDLDLSEFTDQYQAELRQVIDAKIAGAEVVAPAEDSPPKVVNLMEALRKSLDAVNTTKSASKKKAAKVATIASGSERKRRARG